MLSFGSRSSHQRHLTRVLREESGSLLFQQRVESLWHVTIRESPTLTLGSVLLGEVAAGVRGAHFARLAPSTLLRSPRNEV